MEMREFRAAFRAFENNNFEVVEQICLGLLLLENSRPPFRTHPLGFLDCSIYSYGGWRLNIHIWDRRFGHAQGVQHICHSHGWALKSAVVVGEVYDTLFDVTPSAGARYEMHEISYRVSPNSNVDRKGLESISTKVEGEYGCAETLKRQVSAGNIYEIGPYQFHWGEAEDLTMTLVMGDCRFAGVARTIREVDQEFELDILRLQLPAADEKLMVETIVSRLSDNFA